MKVEEILKPKTGWQILRAKFKKNMKELRDANLWPSKLVPLFFLFMMIFMIINLLTI